MELLVHTLNQQGGVNDNSWIDVRGFKEISVYTEGTLQGIVTVTASNKDTKPSDADPGALVLVISQFPDMTVISGPYRWLKARVSGWTSGTVDCYIWCLGER